MKIFAVDWMIYVVNKRIPFNYVYSDVLQTFIGIVDKNAISSEVIVDQFRLFHVFEPRRVQDILPWRESSSQRGGAIIICKALARLVTLVVQHGSSKLELSNVSMSLAERLPGRKPASPTPGVKGGSQLHRPYTISQSQISVSNHCPLNLTIVLL